MSSCYGEVTGVDVVARLLHMFCTSMMDVMMSMMSYDEGYGEL